MKAKIFSGVIPALMTPCKDDRTPDFDALVRKAKELIEKGMSAVVYCGSMGDWPLLSDEQRQALDQANQVLKALPLLPKHRCAPSAPTQRLEDNQRDRIRRLVADTLNERWSCRGTISLDKASLELWARFAPDVPYPQPEA